MNNVLSGRLRLGNDAITGRGISEFFAYKWCGGICCFATGFILFFIIDKKKERHLHDCGDGEGANVCAKIVLTLYIICATILLMEVFNMTQSMSIRIDSDAKKGLADVCKELGLTVSAAFNLFAKKVAKERRIPFELSAEQFYSEENISYLNKVINEIDSGKAKLVEHDIIEV